MINAGTNSNRMAFKVLEIVRYPLKPSEMHSIIYLRCELTGIRSEQRARRDSFDVSDECFTS